MLTRLPVRPPETRVPPPPPLPEVERPLGNGSDDSSGSSSNDFDLQDEGTGWWRWLLLGIVTAFASSFVLPSMFRWFLAAIPHEMGHATIGCLLGHPSAPAISPAGHAWTGIAEQRTWLVWTIALVFGAFAAVQRQRRAACIPLAAMAVLVPLLAFSRASEVAIAAGGHLGELAFATWCFHLVVTGGYSSTTQERIAGAFAGSLLQFGNLRLCAGLMTSAAARGEYAGNGSLGLKNDYLVLAEDLLACRLQSVALVMFVLSLLPLPLGVAIGQWRRQRC
ncbi:MAG TPA: hypothetical protein VK348_08065 [Planctomycetota bacterium]|nr:hypothetical protein [Planctomycetota bacterium]